MRANLKTVPTFLEETKRYIKTPARNPRIAPLLRLIRIINTEADTINRFMNLEYGNRLVLYELKNTKKEWQQL